ncbi:MAG: cytochrome c [Acidobacteria bacterium]|nr:cytochrome c [Acidobacteriota bacterium]
MTMNRTALFLILSLLWLGGVLRAQSTVAASGTNVPTLTLETGRDIFEAACIGCHGPGGRGQPQTTLGFELPATFPDFSDCNGSTREKTYDWRAVIHEGGVGRGFSEIMPSFAEALTADQIAKVMAYMREQCPEPEWPLGELNFPRALITEKAFPEDEWLLLTAVNASGDGRVSNRLFYEKRFGARNQLEFAAPVGFQAGPDGWVGGVGDLVAGYKRVLHSSLASGTILSAQAEVAIPTGDDARQLGSGTTLFETFATAGKILPGLAFVQTQSGVELPVDTEKAPRAAFVRMAIGKTFPANQGFGRSWTPMFEVLADREFETGARTNWDIVPEVQVTLNKRQHVRVNLGIRQPVNNRAGRSTQLVFYTLWDFFDGGLRDGW